MAVYQYNALDMHRAAHSGTVVADTAHSARDKLRAQGLTILRLTSAPEAGDQARQGFIDQWRERRQSKQVVSFVSELSTLLSVGTPLVDALKTVACMYRGRFRASIDQLRDRVEAGMSLAAAMRSRPLIFDELTVSLVEVGEQAGTLDSALRRLADFKQRMAQLKGRIGTALIYPGIVLTLATIVTLFLMSYVVPTLLDSLVQAKEQIPALTQAVKAVSGALLNWWWLMLSVLGAVIAAVGWALRYESVRRWCHGKQLRMPILGPIIRKQSVARLSIVLATLLRSGVEFVPALRIAKRTTPNLAIQQALTDCEQAVSAGTDIAAALDRTETFPPTVLQVFAVGQQSGQLEAMLDRLADDYDRQVALAAQRLTAVLEPLLIVSMVVIVGLIAFATVLPMLQAGQLLE